MKQNEQIIEFPDPNYIDSEDGLIAIGGDVRPSTLWQAYNIGLFPWYNPGEEILWWCPDPRFVLFPKQLKISKSMKKLMDKNYFTITENKCFVEVMKQCASIPRKGQEGTWINEEMIESYNILHLEGKAKSIEVWNNDVLVGGFYGVDLGNVFCGESMFSKESNASKAGFIYFVQKYKELYRIIDCQVYSEHLESLGACEIDKKMFLSFLSRNK